MCTQCCQDDKVEIDSNHKNAEAAVVTDQMRNPKLSQTDREDRTRKQNSLSAYCHEKHDGEEKHVEKNLDRNSFGVRGRERPPCMSSNSQQLHTKTNLRP